MSYEKLPIKIRTIEGRKEKLQRFRATLNEKVAGSGSSRIGEHSEYPLLDYFMGGHTFPEGENDQAPFLEAIHSGNWSNKIFNDESIEQIALQCARQRSISWHQFLTVIQRQQQFLDYPNGNSTVYNLLDEHNQYTSYAEEVYLPMLKKYISLY